MGSPSVTNPRAVFFNWLVLLGLCALIFIQSHGVALQNIPTPMHLDKAVHFACFALLAVLFFRAYCMLPLKPSVKLVVFLSVFSAVVYGVSDEFHQSFVPLRVADGYDLLADALGALCGLGGYLWWRPRGGRPITSPGAAQCFSDRWRIDKPRGFRYTINLCCSK